MRAYSRREELFERMRPKTSGDAIRKEEKNFLRTDSLRWGYKRRFKKHPFPQQKKSHANKTKYFGIFLFLWKAKIII